MAIIEVTARYYCPPPPPLLFAYENAIICCFSSFGARMSRGAASNIPRKRDKLGIGRH